MQTDLTNIKNIIFDLGNVILNLDFNASINAFRKLGLKNDVLTKNQAFPAPCFYKQEIGIITPEEFINEVQIIIDNKEITDQQIEAAWNSMVLDIPEHRVKVLQNLSEKFNLYLFSNTNKLHIDRVHGEFEAKYKFTFPSLFVELFYSHEIHLRKPDLNSFEKVIKLSGVNPVETLFIDDLRENIEGAKKAGLQTFWLKDRIDITEIF